MAAGSSGKLLDEHEGSNKEGGPHTPRARCRLVSVEPITFLILAVQGVLVNLRTQYVESRLALEHNYTLPESGNCSVANSSGDAIGKQVEAETALWVMYMKSTSVFIPIFSGTILIAASDFVGRKPILIINAVGHFLASAVFLLVAWLSLPLYFAIIAEIILGLSGDSVTSMHVAYAYIADTSTGQTRVIKMVVVSFLIFAGFGSSQILVDIILQHTGNYLIAFSCGVAFAVLNFIYVIIPGLLLETVMQRSTFKVVETTKKLLKGFYELLKVTAERRRLRMVILFSLFMVYTIIVEAVYSVISIYGLGQPFCWTPTLYGVYNVIVNVYPALVALIFIKPLLFCLSGYWIMQIGFLSGVALLIVTATATSNVMLVYVAVAAGSLRTIPEALADNFLSRMVSSQEQGVAFALLSVVLSIGKVISPFLLNAVYAKTVVLGVQQVTFYIAAAIYIVPMTLTLLLQFFSRPYEVKTLQLQSPTEPEEEQNLIDEK